MKKSVTMRDIGAALGVSAVTISKALAGKEGVSDAVREKIIKTAQEMGYQYQAQSGTAGDRERERPQEIVGILTPDRFFDAGSFYASLYKEILKHMVDAGMLGVLEIVTADREHACELPMIVSSGRVSSMIVLGQFDNAYVKTLVASGLPVVLLDFYCDEPDTDAVVSDGMNGGYLLTRHLIESGHRDIGFVGSVLATTSAMDRYCGYIRALMEEGLTEQPQWLIGDRGADRKYKAQLILPERLPTAFVCENDVIAMRLIAQLETRGIRVPEDISVTGFDNFNYATLCSPALTTYSVNQSRMAQVAVRQLQTRIAEPGEGPLRQVVGGRVVKRDSTRVIE